MGDGIRPECAATFEKLRMLHGIVVRKLNDHGEALRSIHRALYGNGTPRESISARIERVEAKLDGIKDAKQAGWKTITGLLLLINVIIALIALIK